MSREVRDDRVSAESFEHRYRVADDPWSYRTSHYERSKYCRTLAVLSRQRYGDVFEPGCSIGELTAMLAPRCDRLLATDLSPTAVTRARNRCYGLNHVHIECQDLRAHQFRETFDLIIFSEIGYYFESELLLQIAARLSDSLRPGGELVAVHWRGISPDHLLHGDEVHTLLQTGLHLEHAQAAVHPGFRLDSWMKS